MEHGWPEPSYRSHENWSRNIGADDAHRYARAFQVRFEWLMHGEEPMVQAVLEAAKVQIAEIAGVSPDAVQITVRVSQ